MKIPESALVAGCGYVGSRVAATWQARGLKVFAVTRSELKSQELINARITPILFDLSQATPIPQLPDVDVVLWSVGFERTSGTSRQAIWIDGLQRLLNALPPRREPRRILYMSSTSVYGEGHGQDVAENTVPNPTSEGGLACLAAEQLLQNFATQKSACVSILRFAGIYGPNRLLRRITEMQSNAPITSPPDEWLNLIHVDDAVTAIDCISRLESPPSLINIVASESVTRRQYYTTLAKLVDAPLPTFASAPPESTSPFPRRGGNRRVVSVVRKSLQIPFRYDSIDDGLKAAFL
ncbi:MAG: NAD-dependent epimerase/dehydratase family protein [Planctomycetaceae bacterium]